MKVGDKVRVLRGGDDAHYWNCHSAGDVCTVEILWGDGTYDVDGQTIHPDDIQPIPTPHFKIGQRYTQANGREVTCIALRDDGGMWAVVEMESTAAYAWDKDGNYLSCIPGTGDNWKIIFPPVIETVRIPFHTAHGDVYLSYQTKDGVPDWSSAMVAD